VIHAVPVDRLDAWERNHVHAAGRSSVVGVIGGSGLYELIEPGTAEVVDVETPYGQPSSSIVIGEFAGRRVAFLTRHGTDHTLPPHAINYRANLWALASLGVSAIVSSSAVGSISPRIAPGSFVIPDQLIDRTWGRSDTFFDGVESDGRQSDGGKGDGGKSAVQHLPFAEPYCPELRMVASAALSALGESFTPNATSVVIQGPRFSTRAESRWFGSAGGDIVNMTQYPEAALAAELNVGLVNLSFVTDADAGESGDAAVDSARVFERMAAAEPRIRAAIAAIVAAVPADYVPRQLIEASAVSDVLLSAQGRR
jgi:5'-methylthioadenosine phosphorylase